jgi:hypothetical protein
VFEKAVRAGPTARWHLGTCGYYTLLKQEKRWTAEVQTHAICIKCARAAHKKLPRDEESQPHGRVITAAAARHLVNRRDW